MKSFIRVARTPRIELPFEVVERKGVGHPDTLADAIAENMSRRYSQYVREKFGGYAHHWFDKVVLIGSEASLTYGAGRLERPFHAILTGKCVLQVGKEVIPVDSLFAQAAAAVLTQHLYGFDPADHLRCEVRVTDGRGPGQAASRYRPGDASELVHVLGQGVSNDCNLCAGFAPLSVIEQMVMQTEQYLSDPTYRADYGSGTDVKVVGTRQGDAYHLLVNLPFVADFVSSRDAYLDRVEQARRRTQTLLESHFAGDITIVVNPEKQSGRSYLTATGSVLDTGDVGVVGRGNRINGLITPTRPMSIEASCGKNPLDHTGKLYGIAAHRAATALG
ncbi:MAG: S-adenosylmethionine synthetase, partial [Oxalobacteraceae bacterium]